MSESGMRSERGGGALLVLLAASAALFAGPGVGDLLLVMAALLACRLRPLASAASPLLLLLLFILAASHLAAADSWASWLALAHGVRFALAFLVGAALPGEGAARALRLAMAAAAAAVLLAAHGAWQVFVQQPALLSEPAGLAPRVVAKLSEGRAFSVFLLPGHLGSMAAALAVLLGAASFGLFLARRRRSSWLLAGACLAALACLALSRSLGGAVLLAAGLSVPALMALRGRARLVFVGVGVTAALLAGGAAAWSRSAHLGSDNPAAARARNWVAAGRLIRERPVLGWGGGAFAHEYARVRPPGANATRHAHQFALERAAEHGLVLLPLLAAFTAWFVRLAQRGSSQGESPGERLLLAAPIGAAAVLLGHGMLDFGWSEVSFAVPAALLVGAAVGPALGARAMPARPFATALVTCAGAGLVLIGSVQAVEARRHEAVLEAAARGEHHVAAELANRARRGSPLSSHAWAMEAEAVLESAGGDPDLAALAVNLAEHAARLSPRRAPLHGLRARALAVAGRRLEAWFAAERAVALAPTVEEWAQLRAALRPEAEFGE